MEDVGLKYLVYGISKKRMGKIPAKSVVVL